MGARGLRGAREGLALPGALALTVGIAEAVAALDTARVRAGSVADRAIDGLWAVQIGDLVWCAAGLAALAVARPGARAARIARGVALAVALLAGAIAVGVVASAAGVGDAEPGALAVVARLVAAAAAAVLFALLGDRMERAPVHDDRRWQAPAASPPAPDAASWLARGELLVSSDLAFSPRRTEALQALAALREAAATDDGAAAHEAYRVIEHLRQ